MCIIGLMSDGVKRRYNSRNRRASAEQTRRRILTTARHLFVDRGYAATTMTAIAEGAEVALDTVYASVGPKPALFHLLIETAISGADVPVTALERDYVRLIREEANPARKLEIYAQAIPRIQERLAPLFRVLRQAAPMNPELHELWQEIAERRARNMRMFATELIATGEVRDDLSVDTVADIVWSMNSPEFYALVVFDRGWTPEQFEAWLADAWKRLLLKNGGR